MIKISNIGFPPGYDDLAEKLHALETRQNGLDASGMSPLETMLRIALMNQATSIHLLRPTIEPEGGLTIVTAHEGHTAVWAAQTNEAGLVTAVLVNYDENELCNLEIAPNQVYSMRTELQPLPIPGNKSFLTGALLDIASDMAMNGLPSMRLLSDKLSRQSCPEVAISQGMGFAFGELALAGE